MISASSSFKIAVCHKLDQLQGNQNLFMESVTVIFKTNTAEVLSYYSVEPLYKASCESVVSTLDSWGQLVADKPRMKPCMKVQLTTYYLTNKLVVGISMRLRTVMYCQIRVRCSTCPLVFGYLELSHMIFLMLRKKELLAKLSKFTKWQLL